MSHLVFLVHGMGVHADDKWAVSYIAALEAAYDQYDGLTDKPMTERFQFVPLRYDDIFSGIVNLWADNAEMLAAASKAVGAPVSKLTDWMKGAGELRNNFGWTHAADVLLYRAFSLVRERVCVRVAAQLTQAIEKQIVDTNGFSRWSVIAHSLGTSVIHDTLARLWDPLSKMPGAVAFSAQNEQAQLIAMVANVSRVLETDPYDVFESTVQPGRSAQPGRGCLYYFTARHHYDPFTIPSMFNPQMWPDEAALLAKPPRYLYTQVEHLHDWNVHAFEHYIKNPEVHVPIFRRLTEETAISAGEMQDAIAKFRTFGPLEDKAAIRIRQQLEAVLPAQGADWLTFGKVWKSFIGKGLAGGIA